MKRNRSTERDVELDEGVASSRETGGVPTLSTPTSTPARAPRPTKNSLAGSRARTWDTPARPAPGRRVPGRGTGLTGLLGETTTDGLWAVERDDQVRRRNAPA